MPKPKKTYFNWSSGKDASLALYHLQKNDSLSIDKLLTSVNGHHNRVSMHGLRRELLENQAKCIGLTLEVIELPEQPTMEDYNEIMTQHITGLRSQGYSDCGFGDIYLEDLRAYREEQLEPYNITCHFPLWKKDTKAILSEFLSLGFKAIVVCIKSDLLDKSFAGREIDQAFIDSLPSNVDPCGENGEFHTFCFDGPIFKTPVKFDIGEKVYRAYKHPDQSQTKKEMGFWFCDLIPR